MSNLDTKDQADFQPNDFCPWPEHRNVTSANPIPVDVDGASAEWNVGGRGNALQASRCIRCWMFDSPAGRSPARVAACLITTHSPGKLRVRLSTATFGCLGCKGQRSSWHVWSVSVGLFASMLSSREAGQYHTCDLSKEFQRNNANKAPKNPL